MVTVLATDEQDDQPVDADRWVRLAGRVLEHEGVPDHAELSVAFVGEQAMCDLNRRYAGQDEATDVLAFPMAFPMGDDSPDLPPDVGVLVGDLVICPAVAARNARARARAYEDELALLVVHGLLHLLGMDHARAGQARDMQRRERQLLERFHVAAPATS